MVCVNHTSIATIFLPVTALSLRISQSLKTIYRRVSILDSPICSIDCNKRLAIVESARDTDSKVNIYNKAKLTLI